MFHHKSKSITSIIGGALATLLVVSLAAACSGPVDGGIADRNAATNTTGPLVHVYQHPSCGCCGRWVEHMEAHGFQVEVELISDPGAIKRQYDVPPEMAGCHTAVVDGLIFEGHVPATSIRKLLDERPDGVRGLSLPEMGPGAPGMPGPRPTPTTQYDVVAFGADGFTVFDKY